MNTEFATKFGLAAVELSHKPIFDSYYASLVEPLAEHSFAAAYTWGASLDLQWCVMENHLCLFAGGGGNLSMFVPPVASAAADDADFRHALMASFELMDAYQMAFATEAKSCVEYIPIELAPRVARLAPEMALTPMAHDYIYATSRMIELSGNELKSKRHARGKFMRTYPDHRTELFSDHHMRACCELVEKWCQGREQTRGSQVNEGSVALAALIRRDHVATRTALANWRELGLKGLVLYVGDHLVGFTLGEALSKRQASILIEKTDMTYQGAAQFIFSEFCRLCWADFPECNVGDDWGIPSLRFTKESYRPVRLQPKLLLSR